MPIYKYRCLACDTKVEVDHRMDEVKDEHKCEDCDTPMVRIYSEESVSTWHPTKSKKGASETTKPN